MAATSWCLPAAASALGHLSSAGKEHGLRRQRPDVAVAARSRGGLLCGPFLVGRPALGGVRDQRRKSSRKWSGAVLCMAPEEERITRRSPLDFPIEWEGPKPARRPDIFPQFSPMKTPLPLPLPADPPVEDEEEETEEEDPEKEEEENPDKPESRME